MSTTMSALLHRPSAWLPMVLSVAALVLIGAVLVTQGANVTPAHDEGTPARIFQLLMLVDAIAIATFGLRWLPAAPRAALAVMAVQVLAAVVPIVTIILLER